MPRPIGGYTLAQSAERARRASRERTLYTLGTLTPLALIVLGLALIVFTN